MNMTGGATDGASEDRTLIVDDDEPVRKLYASCLSARYSCVTAGDAQESLVRLTGGGFALDIADVQMPGLSGIERLLRVYEGARLPDDLSAAVAAVRAEIDYGATLEDTRSIIADCHSGAERIRDAVQNLRPFSRLDEAEFKKVDLHEGIESVIRLLWQYYGPGRHALERASGELPLVDCYAGHLNHVWINLLVNAAQATGH